MRLIQGFLVLLLLPTFTALSQTSQFQGSVPTGTASSTPVALTLHDAIDRGLKANLGLLVSDSASEIRTRPAPPGAERAAAAVDAQVGETVEQLSLKTIGFNFNSRASPSPPLSGRFITPTCAPTRPGTPSTTARGRITARLRRATAPRSSP